MSIGDREKALENKFAYDQEKKFRIEARASKLMGVWAAEKLGLSGPAAESYIKEVIASNLDEPGFDDVKKKIQKDFRGRNIEISDHIMDEMIEKKMREAHDQINAEGEKK